MRPRLIWRLGLVGVALAAVPAGRLAAQEPLHDRPGLEELRRRVRERVAQRLRDELRLNDEQMRRLRATVGTYGRERRELEARQRALRSALADQLRPGVAAEPDSVARLMDELARTRVRYAETFGTEQAEMSAYLDPVQRARIALLRERLAERGRALRRRPFRQGAPPE